MFDSVGAFKKQFTRVEGGYLIYPSRRMGGKLVSDEEYERLLTAWERTAGRSGQWKLVGVLVVVIALWTLLSDVVFLPEWADSIFIPTIVAMVSAWLLWASTAPRRLVKDRVAVAPPKAAAEAGQDARAALNWPFVIFALILSGAAFFGSIIATERNLSTWAWLIGSGAMLGLYIWIGFKKLMDRSR